jgi:metal-responsive CopG/Arc/MetJ family transcriptional regulator
MKTAISLQDSLMQQTDAAAKDLGLTRSGLIAEALRQYLRNRRRTLIAEQLNQAYPDTPTQTEKQLTRKLRTKLPIPDRW